MRIVRYPLEIVDYQQLQPLWPGRILSVGATPPFDEHGRERALDDPLRFRVDLWALDNDANRRDAAPPILGVWIVGTGNPIDPDMLDADALFHGTVDHRRDGGGAWHVFTAVVGVAESPEPVERPAYTSVDDMLERIKARRRGNA